MASGKAEVALCSWVRKEEERNRGGKSAPMSLTKSVTQGLSGASSNSVPGGPGVSLGARGLFSALSGPASGSWRQTRASHSLLSPHSRLRGGGSQDSKRPQNKWTSYLISQPGLLSDHYIMARPVTSPADGMEEVAQAAPAIREELGFLEVWGGGRESPEGRRKALC